MQRKRPYRRPRAPLSDRDVLFRALIVTAALGALVVFSMVIQRY